MAPALPVLLTYGPHLIKAGFAQTDIVAIASHHGAAQALPALLKDGLELLGAGFTIVDFVKKASYHGLVHTLSTLLKHRATWLGAGLSHEMVRSIAITCDADIKLSIVAMHHSPLEARGQ